VYDCTKDKSNDYLYDVVKMANSYNLDLAISHHLNSFHDEEANGVEVLVYDLNDKKTVKIANDILSELTKLGLRNRGVKERKNLYWLNKTKAKAILIEYLFVSNKSDVSKYDARRLSEAVVSGLLSNCSIKPPTTSGTGFKYSNGAYSKKGVVVNTNGTGLNVRTERSVNGKIIGNLKEGKEITVCYCIDNWFSTYDTGQLGFIHGGYIKLL
ncbi:MAG: N-acetylmuramoyl-L-alanine amidase, partial [Paraclostridium sp.]